MSKCSLFLVWGHARVKRKKNSWFQSLWQHNKCLASVSLKGAVWWPCHSQSTVGNILFHFYHSFWGHAWFNLRKVIRCSLWDMSHVAKSLLKGKSRRVVRACNKHCAHINSLYLGAFMNVLSKVLHWDCRYKLVFNWWATSSFSSLVYDLKKCNNESSACDVSCRIKKEQNTKKVIIYIYQFMVGGWAEEQVKWLSWEMSYLQIRHIKMCTSSLGRYFLCVIKASFAQLHSVIC